MPSWVTLGALGLMLFIAAIGLWVMMSGLSFYPGRSGRAVLISVGLIILLAGAVLAYAAWKGYKPGWFLWFTIAGALLAGPVILGGIGMLGVAEFENSRSPDHFSRMHGGPSWGWEEDYWEPDEGTWEGQFWGEGSPGYLDDTARTRYQELFEQDRDFDLTWLDASELAIEADNEAVLLDLTTVPRGEDLEYTVALNASTMQIVLTRNQLPLIESLQADSVSNVEAIDFTGRWPESARDSWVEDDFAPEAYPLAFSAGSATNQFTFGFQMADSTVEFIVVDHHVTLRPHHRDHDGRPGHHGRATQRTTEPRTADQPSTDQPSTDQRSTRPGVTDQRVPGSHERGQHSPGRHSTHNEERGENR